MSLRVAKQSRLTFKQSFTGYLRHSYLRVIFELLGNSWQIVPAQCSKSCAVETEATKQSPVLPRKRFDCARHALVELTLSEAEGLSAMYLSYDTLVLLLQVKNFI